MMRSLTKYDPNYPKVIGPRVILVTEGIHSVIQLYKQNNLPYVDDFGAYIIGKLNKEKVSLFQNPPNLFERASEHLVGEIPELKAHFYQFVKEGRRVKLTAKSNSVLVVHNLLMVLLALPGMYEGLASYLANPDSHITVCPEEPNAEESTVELELIELGVVIIIIIISLKK
jgi:hypothetical protein